MKKIIPAVIGLGYVGLPIFLQVNKKFQSFGFDINAKRIKDLIGCHDTNNEFEHSSKPISDCGIVV